MPRGGRRTGSGRPKAVPSRLQEFKAGMKCEELWQALIDEAGRKATTAYEAKETTVQIREAQGYFQNEPIDSRALFAGTETAAQFRRLRPVVPAHRDQCDAGA
jgi:hypothetical protein